MVHPHTSALRISAITVGGITLAFATIAFVFRTQVMAEFTEDGSVNVVGVIVLTAQLVAMIANGFTGLLTSLFQATGRAVQAIVISTAQGTLFIPIELLGTSGSGSPASSGR